jgi:hypothetical protein
MPPDTTGAHVRPANALITAVARRRFAVHAGWAAAAGLVLAALIWTVTRTYDVPAVTAIVIASSAALLVVVLVLWRTAGQRSRYEAARAIETACPDLRNVLVTAEELERHPRRAAPAIAARVFAEADRMTSRVRAAEVVSLRATGVSVATAVAIAVGVTWIPAWRAAPSPDSLARSSEDASSPLAAGSVRFTVVPPAYSELATITLTDPERIVALGWRRPPASARGSARLSSTRSSRMRAATSRSSVTRTRCGSCR